MLVNRSFETLKWMRSKGVRFQPSYGRQAFKVNGKYKFWGRPRGRGPGAADPGLVDLEHKAAVKAGISHPLRDARRLSLIEEDGVVRGVIAKHKGRKIRIGAKAVVPGPAAASRAMPRCARAISARPGISPRSAARGFNTGAGINMGAGDRCQGRTANWSGRPCRRLGHETRRSSAIWKSATISKKHSYPLGIMVNANGLRFVDEGRGLPQLHLRQVRRW